MIVLWVAFGVMGVSLLIILGHHPELLASTLVASAILIPYYAAQPERTHPVNTFTVDGAKVTAEDIMIEQRDGKPYITTSPLPEYIQVSDELWDEILTEAPPIGDRPTDDDPRWAWIEEVQHADDDVDNDGYVLHIDATNVATQFKLITELPDGNRLLRLGSWSER